MSLAVTAAETPYLVSEQKVEIMGNGFPRKLSDVVRRLQGQTSRGRFTTALPSTQSIGICKPDSLGEFQDLRRSTCSNTRVRAQPHCAKCGAGGSAAGLTRRGLPAGGEEDSAMGQRARPSANRCLPVTAALCKLTHTRTLTYVCAHTRSHWQSWSPCDCFLLWHSQLGHSLPVSRISKGPPRLTPGERQSPCSGDTSDPVSWEMLPSCDRPGGGK